MEKIRLFLLDDHRMFLEGIRALLLGDERFTITGEATSARNALEILADSPADIVITDLSMPEMSGIEFSRLLKKKLPEIKILVLSMYSDKGMISEALSAGVSGFILKNTGREELIKALEKIREGGTHFSDAVYIEMMKAIPGMEKDENAIHLTPREKEIIQLIAQEFTNQKIAETLFISERTVETHRKNIFRKTKTQSVVGLMKFAYENRIIS